MTKPPEKQIIEQTFFYSVRKGPLPLKENAAEKRAASIKIGEQFRKGREYLIKIPVENNAKFYFPTTQKLFHPTEKSPGLPKDTDKYVFRFYFLFHPVDVERWKKENPKQNPTVEKLLKFKLFPIETLQDLEKWEIQEKIKEERDKLKKEAAKKKSYPIAKIDRITGQELLPIFINKGIFSNYKTLKTQEEILEKEKLSLNKTTLTIEEERRVLAKTGEYKTERYVIKDYGDYAIGFAQNLYQDWIEEAEKAVKNRLQTPDFFPEMNEQIEKALNKIKLYKMGHRLALVILSETYNQKTDSIYISYTDIFKFLGKDPNKEKQIYGEIKDAIFTLRWLNYKFWDYRYTENKRKRIKGKSESETVGNFIYNLTQTPKGFYLDVNKKFIGCVQHAFTGNSMNKKDRKKVFGGRGYYDFPTRVLALTKDASTSEYLLTDFLIRERGNQKLKEDKFKVLSYKIERYAKEGRIRHSRQNKRYYDTLAALKKVEIISKTDPKFDELSKIKPKEGMKKNLKIWVIRNSKVLDTFMEKKIDTKEKK